MSDTHGLKLNVPRTVLVGLAFFTICMFWQVYDSLMPLFLKDFDFGATLRGVIMALDNVLAVLLLPFMGIWSDRFPMKLRNKVGRRMPFIVCGSVLAACTFMLVNFAHNSRNLALMLAATAFVLVFMCLYRSPAVALMPDVTPKPIRSNANAIINLMGTIGGVITLILMQFLLKTEADPATGELYIVGSNWILVSIISGLMIIAAVVMVLKVRENRFAEESRKIMAELKVTDDEEEAPKEKQSMKKVLGTLTRPQLKSLIFILLSVFLWYMAYNALTTHFSAFSLSVLKAKFTLPLLVANAAAFVMFLPAVKIGKKLGRKKTVMLGVSMMIAGLAFASVFLLAGASAGVIKVIMYPTFVLVGGGWATINVHSYIMCVELSDESTTGTYTGLYYAFSMTAQIITPILAGLVMDYISVIGLVPYSLVFACLALVTMIFVRHGNADDGSDNHGAEKEKYEDELSALETDELTETEALNLALLDESSEEADDLKENG